MRKVYRYLLLGLQLCISPVFAQNNEGAKAGNLADEPWIMTQSVENGTWHGFDVYERKIDKFKMQIAKPEKAAEGMPWVISVGEIGDGFHWQIHEKLLKAGVHVAAINVYDVYGAEYGLDLMDSLYVVARKQFGLPERCGLFGVSRAGLSVYRWAVRHPERTACIYCEGPVMDFKTWPMCWEPSAHNWKELKQYYGFDSDAEAMAYKGNPIDNLKPIAEAKIPLRHVISLTDEHDVKIVPNDKNTLKAQQLLRRMGHYLDVVITPEGMKAPYAFDDASIAFILEHCL